MNQLVGAEQVSSVGLEFGVQGPALGEKGNTWRINPVTELDALA